MNKENNAIIKRSELFSTNAVFKTPQRIPIQFVIQHLIK